MARDLLQLYLTPTAHLGRTRDAVHLGKGHRMVVDCNGRPIHVVRLGSGGRRVLLVHGWSGLPQQLGRLASALVDAGFAVVMPSMPGHGDSPPWEADGTASFGQFAQTIAAVAADVGGVGAIVGHSGGALAAVVALADGLVAERFVGIAMLGRLRGSVDRYLARLDASPPEAAAFEDGMVRRFTTQVWDDADGPALATALGDTAALLIHDDADHHVPLSEAEAMVDAWPGAQLHRTTRYGHHLILRRPDVVAAVVNFLEP